MPPPNLTSPAFFFSSVWDYVPTRLLPTKDTWRLNRSKAHRVKRVDAVDTKSTQCHQNTCLKKSLSNILDARHVAERGRTDRHRTAAAFSDQRHYAIIRFSSDGRDRLRPFRCTWSHHDRWIFIRRTRSRAMGAPCGSRSNLHRTVQKLRGRTPRSRSDQTAIATRSSRDQGVYMVELPPIERTSIDE